MKFVYLKCPFLSTKLAISHGLRCYLKKISFFKKWGAADSSVKSDKRMDNDLIIIFFIYPLFNQVKTH